MKLVSKLGCLVPQSMNQRIRLASKALTACLLCIFFLCEALQLNGQVPHESPVEERGEDRPFRYPARTLFNEWRLIDSAGRLASLQAFDVLGCFRDGVGVARRDQGWHVIDYDGNILFSFPRGGQPSTECPAESTVRIGTNGYLDTRTWQLHLSDSEFLGPFREGLAAIERNRRWGFISPDGVEVIAPEFDSAGHFREGTAPVKSQGKFGFISRSGEWVIHPSFRSADVMSEGSAAVERLDGAWGFVSAGERRFTPVIGAVKLKSLASGLAVFTGSDGQCGYVDQTGSIRISAQFSQCGDFQENVARVVQAGKWGLVDRHGAWISRPAFDAISEFNGPLAGVMNWVVDQETSVPTVRGSHQMTVTGYINRAGKLVWWAGRPVDSDP
ncbi:MAG TPA: hypothetical protein DCY80_01040 [Solibacterales bacterium]|nr:hypothetical protein [Bryobacterales bacterium]